MKLERKPPKKRTSTLSSESSVGRAILVHATESVPRQILVVVTKPNLEGKLAFVRLTTRPGPEVNPLYVFPNELRAATRPHAIRCDLARVTTVEAIQEGLDRGILSEAEHVSREVLARIHQALGDSPHTRLEVINELTVQGFI